MRTLFLAIIGALAVLGGPAPAPDCFPLAAYLPPLSPADLGDPGFLAAHRLKYPYMAGAMANGIGSVEAYSEMTLGVAKGQRLKPRLVVMPENGEAVWAWFAKARLFVLASRWEGCPNAVGEALACGKPVIVTDYPGQADLVRSADCGIVIPPDDPEALAAAVAKLANSPATAMTSRSAEKKPGACTST